MTSQKSEDLNQLINYMLPSPSLEDLKQLINYMLPSPSLEDLNQLINYMLPSPSLEDLNQLINYMLPSPSLEVIISRQLKFSSHLWIPNVYFSTQNNKVLQIEISFIHSSILKAEGTFCVLDWFSRRYTRLFMLGNSPEEWASVSNTAIRVNSLIICCKL